MGTTLTIGSRGSQLALWQANHVASLLAALGIETRITIIRTTGDKLQTEAVPKGEGKGLFTKEIEEALLGGQIDLAVHSLKDLPTEGPEGLTIAAIPHREDPHDALLGKRLVDLGPGAVVGTSSLRRSAQLLAIRPDLTTQSIRGNIDTRIRKLEEGQYEAIVLAAAGLRRLKLEEKILHTFTPDEICPAPGQGALAIQTREDGPALQICRPLNHQATQLAVECERKVLSTLGSGCQLPVGAYAAVTQDGVISLVAVVAHPDGGRILRHRSSGPLGRGADLAELAAQKLLADGAGQILATLQTNER